MSEGPICNRCHVYLPHGQANGILCPKCLEEVAADARRRIREQFLDAIAKNVARAALDARIAQVRARSTL